MHRIIEQYFIDNNYDEIEINIEELKVFYRARIIYCVLNLENQETISSQQFSNILKQLYKGIIDSGCGVDKSMILTCGKDVKYISQLYIDENNEYDIEEAKVIIDTKGKRIMMPETRTEEFVKICVDISEYINNYVSLNRESSNQKMDITTLKENIKYYIKSVPIILTLINIVIFFVSYFFSDELFQQIMDNGALNWKKVLNDGQWYRLITSMFLHWDIDHIFNNMITLCVIGTFLEKIVGKKWVFISYFVTGIIAGLTSMVYNMRIGQDVYAAGASGAIFGIVGMLMALLITSRADGASISGRRLLIYVVLVIWSGLSSSEIDNAAHIGGIFAGVFMGLIYTVIRYMKKRSSK